MKFIQTLGLATLLLCMSNISLATGSHESTSQEAAHGHAGMSKEKMHEMMQMKKKHMETVEQRLTNIEAMLKELLELEKKKHP